MKRITSRQHPLVRAVRDLVRARRAGETALVLDGPHLLQEALAAGLPLRLVAAADDLAASPDGARLLHEAAAAGAEVVTVTRTVLEAMSPTRTPSGLVAVAEAVPASLPGALETSPAMVVAAVDVQDPGNAGAIVRAADAACATAVVFCGASADPFGWKALRGSMGSAFRLPIVPRADAHALIDACRARGIRIWAAAPRGGISLFDADLAGPCCLLFGGEGEGLDPDLVARADARLTIPMRRGVESLNVAVAAALGGYEAFRRRARLAAPPGSAVTQVSRGVDDGRA